MRYHTPTHSPYQRLLIACLVTPLALFAPGCGQDNKTITSSTSKFEVDDQSSAPSSSPPRNGVSSEPVAGSPGGSTSAASSPPSSRQPSALAPSDSPQPPPSIPQSQLDDLVVPDGTPEQLWEFIQDVVTREPRGRTQQEIMGSIQEIMSARIGAAEKLLEHPDATTEQRRSSVEVKLSTLQELMTIGVAEAEGHFKEFCRALVKDEDEELAKFGRMLTFSLDVNDLVEGVTSDGQEILAKAEKLLNEEAKNNETFQYVRAAALELLQGGYPEEGKQLVARLKEVFAGVTDEQVPQQLASLSEEAHFLIQELPQKLTAFVRSEPDSLEPLRAASRSLLEQDEPGMTALQQSLFIADAMERNGEIAAAQEILTRVTEVYSSSENEELAALAKEATESADRRLGMLNQLFSLTGQLSDGTELNWQEFSQGNVVLVTFWSIENRPYLQQELPEIKRLLEVYQDKGFRVVGINVDEEPEMIQQFFRFQSIPWPNVMDGTVGGGQMVRQTGVATIPFSILIDREGKVAALHVNSQGLPEKLLELLN